ncbi:hypothetical protein [Haloglomus litoreum]|nr:hypothetical protein [Haloglomus sp. DT116]
MRTEWLFPADTVRGRADRAHVDLRQRTLREYADGTNDDPLPATGP